MFNVVKALEGAGIDNFRIYHDARAVYVDDLNKLTSYLGIPNPKGNFIMYQGWNLIESSVV